ncbi:hypothetical protein T07_12098 [Trichinella nelsoni]|uniref:Uncharacterized protein n=1 Tax=Trichinella nelsoni TaxID=6336 RepID=A0A0V0S2S3_9BILA|nr:hypothetical protein T07_12098 [Trichinella nelsoni]
MKDFPVRFIIVFHKVIKTFQSFRVRSFKRIPTYTQSITHEGTTDSHHKSLHIRALPFFLSKQPVGVTYTIGVAAGSTGSKIPSFITSNAFDSTPEMVY